MVTIQIQEDGGPWEHKTTALQGVRIIIGRSDFSSLPAYLSRKHLELWYDQGIGYTKTLGQNKSFLRRNLADSTGLEIEALSKGVATAVPPGAVLLLEKSHKFKVRIIVGPVPAAASAAPAGAAASADAQPENKKAEQAQPPHSRELPATMPAAAAPATGPEKRARRENPPSPVPYPPVAAEDPVKREPLPLQPIGSYTPQQDQPTHGGVLALVAHAASTAAVPMLATLALPTTATSAAAPTLATAQQSPLATATVQLPAAGQAAAGGVIALTNLAPILLRIQPVPGSDDFTADLNELKQLGAAWGPAVAAFTDSPAHIMQVKASSLRANSHTLTHTHHVSLHRAHKSGSCPRACLPTLTPFSQSTPWCNPHPK